MRNRETKEMFFYDWAADEDSKPKCWFVAERAFRIVSAKLHSSATVTDQDTDYNTFTIQAGSTALATLANGPAAGGVPITAAGGAFTLVAVDAAAGDVISLKSVKTGSGLAVADCSVTMTIEFVD